MYNFHRMSILISKYPITCWVLSYDNCIFKMRHHIDMYLDMNTTHSVFKSRHWQCHLSVLESNIDRETENRKCTINILWGGTLIGCLTYFLSWFWDKSFPHYLIDSLFSAGGWIYGYAFLSSLDSSTLYQDFHFMNHKIIAVILAKTSAHIWEISQAAFCPVFLNLRWCWNELTAVHSKISTVNQVVLFYLYS